MNASEGILTGAALVARGIDAKNVEWLMEQFAEASLQMEELRKTISADKKAASMIAEMRFLIKEVMDWHADTKGPDYNECDKEPCHWCSNAHHALSTDCGKGWLSPETARLARGALERICKLHDVEHFDAISVAQEIAKEGLNVLVGGAE